MSTCYLCLSSHRKSIYGTRNAMRRKTGRFRLSQKIMKFYVLTRFRETIPTVQSVSSSEILEREQCLLLCPSNTEKLRESSRSFSLSPPLPFLSFPFLSFLSFPFLLCYVILLHRTDFLSSPQVDLYLVV